VDETGSALRAFYRLYAERHGRARFGDKTPKYLTKMRRIAALLPEATFVHLVRDGRDVALSKSDRSGRPPAESASRPGGSSATSRCATKRSSRILSPTCDRSVS
jgi:hypothetical protein